MASASFTLAATALAAFASLAAGAPALEKRASLPPHWTSVTLGNTTSNFPNIYRDGGGGGQINGINFIIFSDGIYTTGGPPKSDFSNWANFTSNSIAASGYDGKGPRSLMDFGNAQKGPLQMIPYFYNNGEDDGKTGIWPNNGITTLTVGPDKGFGVLFPQVVNRTALGQQKDGTLYNTPVLVGVSGYGPYTRRPVQALFRRGEVQYGLFGSLAGADGYLYMYASVTNTTNSNGLKMARVPQSSWSDRSQFQYWNGASYQSTAPAYDDNGRANVFNYSQSLFGQSFGPGTGELFWNNFYNTYFLMFQPADAALDSNVYLSYSSDATKGWSTPQRIYDTKPLTDGYNYAFHAYPNYDSTHRVIPISWSAVSQSQGYLIGMANITFS